MNKQFINAAKTASLFVSIGLFVSLLVFFLFFGKGLQILIPFILFAVFCFVYYLCEKILFIRERPFLKAIISVVFIVIFIILL